HPLPGQDGLPAEQLGLAVGHLVLKLADGSLPRLPLLGQPVERAANVQVVCGEGVDGLGPERHQCRAKVPQRIDRRDAGGGLHESTPCFAACGLALARSARRFASRRNGSYRCCKYSSTRSALRSKNGMCTSAAARNFWTTRSVSSNSSTNFTCSWSRHVSPRPVSWPCRTVRACWNSALN